MKGNVERILRWTRRVIRRSSWAVGVCAFWFVVWLVYEMREYLDEMDHHAHLQDYARQRAVRVCNDPEAVHATNMAEQCHIDRHIMATSAHAAAQSAFARRYGVSPWLQFFGQHFADTVAVMILIFIVLLLIRLSRWIDTKSDNHFAAPLLATRAKNKSY
jgi:cytochrome bd-type quinol oxidase subunit 2